MTTENSGEAVCECGHVASAHLPEVPTDGDIPGTMATCSTCLDNAMAAYRKKKPAETLFERCRHSFQPAPENSEGSVPADVEIVHTVKPKSQTILDMASTDRIQEAREYMLGWTCDRSAPPPGAEIAVDRLIARVRESVEEEMGKRLWRVVAAPELDQATADGVLHPGQRVELIECENCEEQREKYQELVKAASRVYAAYLPAAKSTPEAMTRLDVAIERMAAALPSTEIKGETAG